MAGGVATAWSVCPAAADAGAGVAIGIELAGAEQLGAAQPDLMPHRPRPPAWTESAITKLRVTATKLIVKILNMIMVLSGLNVGNTCDTSRERQQVTPEHRHRGFERPIPIQSLRAGYGARVTHGNKPEMRGKVITSGVAAPHTESQNVIR